MLGQECQESGTIRRIHRFPAQLFRDDISLPFGPRSRTMTARQHVRKDTVFDVYVEISWHRQPCRRKWSQQPNKCLQKRESVHSRLQKGPSGRVHARIARAGITGGRAKCAGRLHRGWHTVCSRSRRMRRSSVSVPALLAGLLILAELPFGSGSVVQAQAPAANAEVDSSPASAGGAAPASGADQGDDWRQILPGVTLGAQMRLRTESRRNFKFDAARPGNDEGFLLSRFRFGLTWKPSDTVTGVVEFQDARIHGETATQRDARARTSSPTSSTSIKRTSTSARPPPHPCRSRSAPAASSCRTARNG